MNSKKEFNIEDLENTGKRYIIIAKGHNDKVYAYLQSISKWTQGTNFRYIYKNELNQKEMAEKLNMAQSTISSAMKKMIVGPNQLIEDKGAYYNLPGAKEGTMYYLVDNKLNYQMATKNGLTKDCIKVYGIVALYYDLAKDKSKAHIYKSKILEHLGLTNTGPNVEKVRCLLNTLSLLGLIELEDVEEPSKNGKVNIRHIIKAVNTEIKQVVK